MKKSIFVLLIAVMLLAVPVKNVSAQDAATVLPEFVLSCTQHTVKIQIGVLITIEYTILVTVCDNGTEYYDLI
jgi:hypothetical protein